MLLPPSCADHGVRTHRLPHQVTSALKTVRQEQRVVAAEVQRLKAASDHKEMLLQNAGRVNYWTLEDNGVQYRKGDCIYFNDDDDGKGTKVSAQCPGIAV